MTHPQSLHSLLYIHSQLQSHSPSLPPTHLHSDKHFPLMCTHACAHTHTHTHTSCSPLQAQGGRSRAQCPEVPGASTAKCQAGTELGDELRGHGGLPSRTDTLSLRRAGALNTELPQDRRASGARDSPNKPL